MNNRQVFIAFPRDETKPPVIVFRRGDVDRTYRVTQQRYNRIRPMCALPVYGNDNVLRFFCVCDPGAILTPATAGKGE